MLYNAIIVLVVILLLQAFIVPLVNQSQVTDVTYDQFIAMLDAGNVTQVALENGTIVFIAEDEATGASRIYRTGAWPDDNLTERLLDHPDVSFQTEIVEETSTLVDFLVGWVLPYALIFGMGYLLMRSMRKRMGGENAMSFGKANAKIVGEEKTGVTFNDVAGEDEAKEALSEIVNFLHDPHKYSEIGAKLPKGALLVGPPGTGKTLLAKAVAGEANVPFFSISGSEFVQMFVGMGAAKVRDLFKQAGEKAPCIVFIDEIDTIGKKRDNGVIGGNDEREQTLNQLLTEMDGFDANKGVVILAATNRPDSLDPALLRPGRFDRRIPVELPDLAGREAILRVHARQVKLERNIDFTAIARATSGASGAELANIINEAALRAVREGRSLVSQADLEECVETVIAGYQRKNAVLSDHEKRVVAYHEVGHALVAALQSNTAPVTKITIVPRTSGALGYTMQVDQDDKKLLTREELLSKIAVLTGGRAAEEVVFGSVTTGASNDIEQATKLARAMITRYGMSDEFGMVAMETISNQYLGGDSSLACSPDTATAIDKQVVEVVRAQHDKAVNLLKNNMASLNRVAEFLYREETITGEQFMSLLRGLPEPGETSADAQA
ncbi:MAG TPA: ATP-dependent zinc metalloprotease FtsH [Candidatus Pullichristensenella stercorigallinarum]|uniref:ATP-dependent zinc metalloprotease FtsH n=1 Tax=Candidatus Pullichristensenella stercorigallinarum TaxID=2840909 RepID=A0A9D1CW40_9FIRM|nr:ATP-dependent zinc metalloprotease FtsH [Candidatus Pullichristensenella stercorigallinarum]